MISEEKLNKLMNGLPVHPPANRRDHASIIITHYREGMNDLDKFSNNRITQILRRFSNAYGIPR